MSTTAEPRAFCRCMNLDGKCPYTHYYQTPEAEQARKEAATTYVAAGGVIADNLVVKTKEQYAMEIADAELRGAQKRTEQIMRLGDGSHSSLEILLVALLTALADTTEKRALVWAEAQMDRALLGEIPPGKLLYDHEMATYLYKLPPLGERK